MKNMDKRNLKTILRDNLVHKEYNALILRGGEFATAVSRKFIYQAIAKRTGYSTRTIAEILNHTRYTPTAYIDEADDA